jgi:hypothetical protein
VKAYVENGVKLPWCIDLLNIDLGTGDVAEAKHRIRTFVEEFQTEGRRITSNVDFT